MTSLLRRPSLWLAIAAAFSLANSFAAHGFHPVSEPDSDAYLDYDWSSITGVLSNKRTPGYPLFLNVVVTVAGTNAVPFSHWLMLIAACLVFYRGATATGLSRSAALFAASALMLSRASLKLGPLITADSLAISLSIAGMGFFLATFAQQSGWSAWIGLTAATFLTYQVRPAYLFLIPLWPVVAFLVDRLIVHREEALRMSLRRCLMYVAATFGPFLAYALLRLIIVGHFGLVSFGGYNFVGVVGQFLDPDSVAELSPDSQPLAEAILNRRDDLTHWEPPGDFHAMERMYNPTVWQLAVPAAEEVHGEDAVAVNAALSRLGKELLFLHPDHYVKWLAWNSWHAVVQIVTLTALDRATVVLMLLLFTVHLTALVRGPAVQRSTAFSDSDEGQRFLDLHLVFWTVLAFATAKALLVVLVEPANDRYMTGAMTFLPGAIGIFALYCSHIECPACTRTGRKES